MQFKNSRWRHGTIVSNILYYKLSSGLHCLLKSVLLTALMLKHWLFRLQFGIWSDTHTHAHVCTSIFTRMLI